MKSSQLLSMTVGVPIVRIQITAKVSFILLRTNDRQIRVGRKLVNAAGLSKVGAHQIGRHRLPVF